MQKIDEIRQVLRRVSENRDPQNYSNPQPAYLIWNSRTINGASLDPSTASRILGNPNFKISGNSENAILENSGNLPENIISENSKKPENTEKCVFCAGSDHISIDCLIYWNSNVRRKRISSQKRCLACLQCKSAPSHTTCPRQNVECSLCSSASRKYFHHSFLCNFYSIEKPTEAMKAKRVIEIALGPE